MPAQKPIRELFDDNAVAYDAIRPGYLPQQIEDILTISEIPPHGSILEVGCGTGQATLPFAQRGYAMLCLDIGANMLAVAREKLRGFPNVRLVCAAFEDWAAEDVPFDLVISATAFPWIPPEIGYPKAANLLEPSGALAVFSNEHPRPPSGFFTEVQEIYQRFMPAGPKWKYASTQEAVNVKLAEIRSMGLFGRVSLHCYPWRQTYTSGDYVRLLDTYSDHRALEETSRRALYQQIRELIDRRYGGAIEKEYLAVTYLCQK